MGGKNKRKGPKEGEIQTDEKGHFVWETFFLRGKQKRRKVRVTVIDGEIIEDLDTWLLANADDIALHQMERWDLMMQRQQEEEAPFDTMKPEPRKLALKIEEIETAFEMLRGAVSAPEECPEAAFLDLTTGKVVWAEDEEEIDAGWTDPNLLPLPEDLDEDGDAYATMEEFARSRPEGPVRQELIRALQGKGAFRRFKNIVIGGGDVELKDAWNWLETKRQRQRIVEWLEVHGIEPRWDCDLIQPPQRPDKRPELLRAVLQFVRDARRIDGVCRIALLGSLTTDKAIPKDVDVLVEVTDDAPLDGLARRKRQLLGKAMQSGDGCGADVFLCNPQGEYLGRVCSWKQCAPGVRQSCQAQHCGRRQFLCDDRQNVTLKRSLLAAPPLDLWPAVQIRVELPADVRTQLVVPLEAGSHEPS